MDTEKRSDLPEQIDHPLHLHPISLIHTSADEPASANYCSVCGVQCGGSPFYKCSTSGCSFNADISCSSIKSVISFYGHPRHPIVLVEESAPGTRCKLCYGEPSPWMFVCGEAECDYTLHLSCGPLPRVLRHSYCYDELTLTDHVASTNSSDPDDCGCDICEQPRDPAKFVYHSTKVLFTAAVDCCLLPQITLALQAGNLGDIELRTVRQHHIGGKVISNPLAQRRLDGSYPMEKAGSEEGEVDLAIADIDLMVEDMASLSKSIRDVVVGMVRELRGEPDIPDGAEDKDDEASSSIPLPVKSSSHVYREMLHRDRGSPERDGVQPWKPHVIEFHKEGVKAILKGKEIAVNFQYSDEVFDQYRKQLLEDMDDEANWSIAAGDGRTKIGDRNIPSNFVPLYLKLVDKYGDFGSDDKRFTSDEKDVCLAMFLEVIYKMQGVPVPKVTDKLLHTWLYCIRTMRDGGMEVQFALDALEKLVRACFGLRILKIKDDTTQNLTRKIDQISKEIDEERAKLDERKAIMEQQARLKEDDNSWLKQCLAAARTNQWKTIGELSDI